MSLSLQKRTGRWSRPILIVAAAVLLGGLALSVVPSSAEDARMIPAPVLDESGKPAKTEVAVLAGGCFWGVQGVFQHVEGVTSAVSGYAGGAESTAQYKQVTTGRTGHAEAVRVTFDPQKISFARILQIYFSVAHDPTELNRQGPDTGTQYRSAIFPVDARQARVAEAYIKQLNEAAAFDKTIATRIEADQSFYPAEDYHQDFLTRNPLYPYIVINDLPKIENLKQLFPDRYRVEPVLVSAGLSEKHSAVE